jgi:hypothetical protein
MQKEQIYLAASNLNQDIFYAAKNPKEKNVFVTGKEQIPKFKCYEHANPSSSCERVNL